MMKSVFFWGKVSVAIISQPKNKADMMESVLMEEGGGEWGVGGYSPISSKADTMEKLKTLQTLGEKGIPFTL